MVFQSYALYPHMTVLGTLTYSLRFKRVASAEARRRAEEVAAVTGLSQLLQRYPRELSGGQRQRVAMGWAIVREPKAFLFNEPVRASRSRSKTGRPTASWRGSSARPP